MRSALRVRAEISGEVERECIVVTGLNREMVVLGGLFGGGVYIAVVDRTALDH